MSLEFLWNATSLSDTSQGILKVTEAISIVEQGPEATATKKIGLIGGLALRAGVFYYEQILKRYAAEKRTLRLVLGHADVNTVP